MLTKQDLIKANVLALKYFCNCLKDSSKAQKYLYNRISRKIADRFHLGYAPSFRGGLKNKIEDEIGYEVGLFNKKDGTYYEFFSDRIMFPLFDIGIVIGFAGRTLKVEDDFKYLNIKNTQLFNKSETLYILDYAKQHIYDKNFAILVEGQFDVLCLIDHGVSNVVASCGTAFKIEHARLLKRWTDRVLIAFDFDQAGILAAEKAKKILKGEGIYWNTIKFPPYHDAASYVKEFGASKFKELE